MAEEELQMEEGGKKSKLMMIIIIAVVVLIAGGGAAYYFLMGSDEPAPVVEGAAAAGSPGVDDAAAANTALVKTGTALYVAMPRPLTFNAPGSTRDRFVEIKVQLMMRGSDNEEQVKMHIPLIEGSLLTAFSTSNADDLATEAGKSAIRANALKEVQKVLVDVTGNQTVEEVLFTGFVMQ